MAQSLRLDRRFLRVRISPRAPFKEIIILYPSLKVKPYVYICSDKETGEFYIGYREKNVALCRTSNIDLPLYKTSSKKIRLRFDNFNCWIVAEFESGNDAYDFEQQLIFENWDSPLLLNRQYRLSDGKKRFKATSKQTEEHKRKRLDQLLGKKRPVEVGDKIRQTRLRKSAEGTLITCKGIMNQKSIKLRCVNLKKKYCVRSVINLLVVRQIIIDGTAKIVCLD